MRGKILWERSLVSWLGTPYGLGGTTKGPSGEVDCANFIAGTLREVGFPSFPASNVEMLHASPLFIPTPLRRAVRGRGVLLWGWETFEMVGLNQLQTADYDDQTGSWVLDQTYNNVESAAADPWCAQVVSEYQNQLKRGEIPAQDVLVHTDSGPGFWSWLVEEGSPSWYPFLSAYHHIAAILGSRHIIHSTVTGSSNGVQIQSLPEVLRGNADMDQSVADAFALSAGFLVNVAVGVVHSFTSLKTQVDIVDANSGVKLKSIQVDVAVDARSGIISGRMNEAFLRQFSNAIGPTWEDAISIAGIPTPNAVDVYLV